MSAAAAARARLSPDEDSTMFFPGGVEPDSEFITKPPSGFDELGTLADLDGLAPDLDAPIDYEDPLDEHGGESAAALLAAKAEPLGRDRRPPTSSKSGRPPRSGRPQKRGDAKRSARAGGGRKPKEPSKLLIGLGVALVALAGLGVIYYLAQRGDDSGTAGDQIVDGSLTQDDQADPSAEGTEEVTGDGSGAMEDEAAGPVTELPPVVIFDQAAVGPIDAGVEYQIAVGDGPANAQYQLLVDGVAAAEPAPVLPPVTFEPGRHLLVIDITGVDQPISTNPVVVYAVGAVPAAGFRANLSSVNIETEGWAEAVRQFDEFVAAGHTDLKLMPSDPFPSLVPGYWNLFVDGFDSATGATNYCEGAGLVVPEQCFAQPFDPNAPAGG